MTLLFRCGCYRLNCSVKQLARGFHFSVANKRLIAKSLLSIPIRRAVLGSPLTNGASLSTGARKTVGYWLLGCSGMVFGAVILGGATRGMKPPLSEESWQIEFDKYKRYPEYYFKTGSREMTMSEFKFIWAMEYLHRMWGRAIGIVYLLPAAFFWYRGYFNSAMKKRIGFAGALLVFQGVLGWYMVKSGLDPSKNSDQNIPRVSQYRLAAHLGTAFVLYTVLLWCGLSHVFTHVDHSKVPRISLLRGFAHGSKTAIFLTAVMGAFVAGLDAGLVYNSWPKFADRWIPTDLWTKTPSWKNFTENPTMVQFIHRGLAYVALALVTTSWLVGRKLYLPTRTKFVLNSLLGVMYAQVALGILALINYVPVWLGVLHQSGSLVVLTFAFWLTSEIRRFPGIK